MKKRGSGSKKGGDIKPLDKAPREGGEVTTVAPVSPPDLLAKVIEVPKARDPLADFFVTEEELSLTDSGLTGEQKAALRASRAMVELLSFWVADEEYALEIVEIQEIIKLPNVTEVPRAHHSVIGIISLRGTIVPVVDLRTILHLEQRPVSRQSRILVLRADGDPVGLLVDRVTSVVRLENESIEATPRAMQRQESDLLRGVGRVGGRLIIILDVGAVLTVVESAA